MDVAFSFTICLTYICKLKYRLLVHLHTYIYNVHLNGRQCNQQKQHQNFHYFSTNLCRCKIWHKCLVAKKCKKPWRKVHDYVLIYVKRRSYLFVSWSKAGESSRQNMYVYVSIQCIVKICFHLYYMYICMNKCKMSCAHWTLWRWWWWFTVALFYFYLYSRYYVIS